MNSDSTGIRFGFVVPCYNEADRLKTAEFIAFCNAHAEYIFLFVNDGSKDQTLKLLQELHSINPRQMLFYDQQPNAGKAEAVRNGLIQLRQKINCDFYGFIDADLAIPLDHLLKMQSLIDQGEHPDLLLTSRYKYIAVRYDSFVRNLISKWYNRVVNIVLPGQFHFSDTQCGCKMISSDCVEAATQEAFLSPWLFDAELIFRIYRQNPQARFSEVQLNFLDDNDGSRIRKRDSLRMMLDILRIFIKYRLLKR